ncbi:hypothetical protein D3C81_1102870 [compost metagenome]
MQLPVVTPDTVVVEQVQANQIPHHAAIIFLVKIFRAVRENRGVHEVRHAGVTTGTRYTKIFNTRDVELGHTANRA